VQQLRMEDSFDPYEAKVCQYSLNRDKIYKNIALAKVVALSAVL